jgi:hypothetical protein
LWDVDARGFGFIGFSSARNFAVVDASGYAIASEDVGGVDQICLGIWDHSLKTQVQLVMWWHVYVASNSFLCVIHQPIQ